MNGFNPQQLVARGVFSSLDEADAVLCRWDEARARSTITPDAWRRGMALDIPISRRRMSAGEVSPELFTAAARGSADSVVSAGPVLCPWCALERAYQGHGSAPRTGFVSVARCARHAATSALLAPQSNTPPVVRPAISHAATAGFPSNPNPNAGVVQAFPTGRWS